MISVIVPVYNGEAYIKRLAACFMAQTLMDFELIFVNDGSTDASLLLLEELQRASFLSIKVANQPNAGVSAARNTGIALAKGEFLCFVDADDQVKPRYLESMATVFQEHPEVDVAICKSALLKQGRELSGKESGEVRLKTAEESLTDFLYGRFSSGCCNIMVRKEILIQNGLKFASGYQYSEDLHMLWRILYHANNVAFVDQYLYLYILREGSATSRFDDKRFQGLELMEGLNSYFNGRYPAFEEEYRQFGAPRIFWSILWQAATNMNSKEFRAFIQKQQARERIRGLTAFPGKKVSLSARVFLVSPSVFRMLAILFGKKYIH